MYLGFHFDASTFARSARRLLFLLLAFEFAILALHFLNAVLGTPVEFIRSFLSVDGEGGLASWFSSLQLFLVGLLMFALSRQQAPGAVPSRRFLLAGSLVFLFLSLDEGAAFHEKITFFLMAQSWTPKIHEGRAIWILSYLAAALLLLFVLRRDLLALWRTHRSETLLMFAGFFLFVLGAAGLETLAYLIWDFDDLALGYQIELFFEEWMEMGGISLILYSLLLLARKNLPQEVPQPVSSGWAQQTYPGRGG